MTREAAMADSIDASVFAALEAARRPRSVSVPVGDGEVVVRSPFPSPADWRDVWIYFLLVDRFARPFGRPHLDPWDGSHEDFQGGNLPGVQAHLDHLADLGVGAIWLSPVLWNPQWDHTAYHGYGRTLKRLRAVERRTGYEHSYSNAHAQAFDGTKRCRAITDARPRRSGATSRPSASSSPRRSTSCARRSAR